MFLMSKNLWNKCFGSQLKESKITSKNFDFERFKNEYKQYKNDIIYNIEHINSKDQYEDDIFLKKMTYLKECYDNQQIRYMGNGSSRIVFAFSDGKALKCALNKTGIAQNRNEIKNIKTTQKQYKCFPNIYSYDSQNLYLITDCCRLLEEEDIKSFFNLSFLEFIDSLQIIINSIKNKKQILTVTDILKNTKNQLKFIIEQIVNKYKKQLKKINNSEKNDKKIILQNLIQKKINYYYDLYDKLPNFINLLLTNKAEYTKSIKSIIQFYSDVGTNNMSFDDLYIIENWGILKKGNYDIPVIIDAGLSNYIVKKYFR